MVDLKVHINGKVMDEDYPFPDMETFSIISTETAVRMMDLCPGISQDVLRYVSRCKECQENKPSLGKTVSIWTEAEVWERLHMDCGYARDQGNILVIVDTGSKWIDAFSAGNRTSQTVKVHLSHIFARFGIRRILVSDNRPEFVSSDLRQWCGSLGIKKRESPIYHPRAHGIAERAVQTVKRAFQAWSLWWHIGTLPRRGAKLL